MTTGPKALIRRRVGGILALLLGLGPAVVLAAPSAEAYTPSAAVKAAYQTRVIQLVNAQRAMYHRGGLLPTYCPGWYATHWSYYLATSGQFYHQSMYPILRTCRATVAAENLGRGNVSPERMVAAWMASPGHRANILDGRLTRIGVAAYFVNGQWTIATDFTRN